MNTATATATTITVTMDDLSATYTSKRKVPTTHVAAKVVDGAVTYTEHTSRALAAKAAESRGAVVIEVTR